MNRLPLVLSSIAVAILAGCATESRVTSAPAPVAAAPAVVAAPAVAPRDRSPGGCRCSGSRAAARRSGPHRIDSDCSDRCRRPHGVDVDQAHRHEDGRRLDAILRHGSRGSGDGRPHRDHEGRHHAAPGIDARISPGRLASLLTWKGPLARPSSFFGSGQAPSVLPHHYKRGKGADHADGQGEQRYPGQPFIPARFSFGPDFSVERFHDFRREVPAMAD